MSNAEQFVLLAKGQKGRACEALIQQVLNNRKIFVFGELLALKSVQDVSNPERRRPRAPVPFPPSPHPAPHNAPPSSTPHLPPPQLQGSEYDKTFQTLQLFAYGTYQEYMRGQGSYIELTDAMRTKLRQLSIVSIAADSKIIPYATLRRELDMDNVRVLEDLIIETIYAGLLSGKLDQRGEVFRVKGTMGRDILPDKLGGIIEQLSAWRAQCTELIAAVQASSHTLAAERDRSRREQDELNRSAQDVRASLKESMASGDMSMDRDGDKIRGYSSSSFASKAMKRSGRGAGGGGGMGSMGGLRPI